MVLIVIGIDSSFDISLADHIGCMQESRRIIVSVRHVEILGRPGHSAGLKDPR
jgi:hypothetical protein